MLLTRPDRVDRSVAHPTDPDLTDPDVVSLGRSATAANPEALDSFLVLARELSFTRAARLLYLSQPGLTRRIQSLERQLGVRLLSRTTRRVTLTPGGAALLALLEPLPEAAVAG